MCGRRMGEGTCGAAAMRREEEEEEEEEEGAGQVESEFSAKKTCLCLFLSFLTKKLPAV